MAANSSFVLALGLVLGWSTAQAAPHRDGASRRSKPPRPPIEAAPTPAEDSGTAHDAAARPDAKQVAFDAGDDHVDGVDDKAVDRPAAAPAAAAPTPAARGWQVEIGPYVWVSSVDASVSFGALSTGVDIGFVSLVRHTRYGAEALAEVRHGRFAVSGDVMYGAAAFTTATDIASVMTTLSGNASSLMLDGAVGYQVLGDEDALVSLEARSGVRYQSTTISGEVGAAGFAVQTPEFTDSATDLVVGARAVVRPAQWLRVSGMFDVGVAGASDSTWSATVDAGVHVSSHVLVTAGWRTLTVERSRVNLQLRGPRVAIQLVF